MSIQQLRARLDALKRRYALPLLILRLRRRAENLCQLWDTADIAERLHNQPFPDVVLMVPDFARDGPLLPPFLNSMRLIRYLQRNRSIKIHPTPYGIVQALLPYRIHKTGRLTLLMKLYLPER